MPQYRIATLDTRTRYISRVGLTVEDCKGMARNSLNIAFDGAQATLHINYGAVVLKARVGFDGAVILAEDTTFGGAITGQMTDVLAPVAGNTENDIISYGINRVEFATIFAKVDSSGANFMYQVSGMAGQFMSSQHVKPHVRWR